VRGIRFEEVVLLLAGDDLLDVIEHPDSKKYPGQRIFIVRVGDRIVSVPFVEDEEKVFFKTIIPSRKLKRIYEKRKGR